MVADQGVFDHEAVVGPVKVALVLQRRYGLARAGGRVKVERRRDHAAARHRRRGASTSPQGPMTIERPQVPRPSSWRPPWAGARTKAAGLDRPGAQQHLPVRLAGGPGEGRRHGDQAGARLGQGAVEIGETHVVADGQAEPAPNGVGATTACVPGV